MLRGRQGEGGRRGPVLLLRQPVVPDANPLLAIASRQRGRRWRTCRRRPVASLGPADHADAAVHSCAGSAVRRSYTNAPDGGALLLVTDTSYAPIVEGRIRQISPDAHTDFGIRRVAR